MRTYTIFWTNGTTSLLDGRDYVHALARHHAQVQEDRTVEMYGEGNIKDEYKWENGAWEEVYSITNH